VTSRYGSAFTLGNVNGEAPILQASRYTSRHALQVAPDPMKCSSHELSAIYSVPRNFALPTAASTSCRASRPRGNCSRLITSASGRVPRSADRRRGNGVFVRHCSRSQARRGSRASESAVVSAQIRCEPIRTAARFRRVHATPRSGPKRAGSLIGLFPDGSPTRNPAHVSEGCGLGRRMGWVGDDAKCRGFLGRVRRRPPSGARARQSPLLRAVLFMA
jgi:hypothetical protein